MTLRQSNCIHPHKTLTSHGLEASSAAHLRQENRLEPVSHGTENRQAPRPLSIGAHHGSWAENRGHAPPESYK